MKVWKLINNYRLRVWVYSKRPATGWGIHRKVFRRLGYVLYLGRVRISFTLLGNKMVLFNPFTLERIPSR